MTNTEVKVLSKHYEGERHIPNFNIGFEMGFFKALDFLGLNIEAVKIPVEMEAVFRRKHPLEYMKRLSDLKEDEAKATAQQASVKSKQ